MRFAFIHAERVVFPVAALCRAMQVARSGYYAWATRAECARRREDRVLAAHVAAAFERSRRSYGSPRISAELRAEGVRVGRARIARLMRENGLSARRRKAFRATPDSCGSAQVVPNRLDRRFAARGPDRKWVTDVKYVRTGGGWLYLAPVVDVFSRRVVGLAMSDRQDGELAMAALADASKRRGWPRGVMLHSDRGGIYGDERYVARLAELGMRRSMSRKRNPWDNAVIESFFSTLTFELLSRHRYQDHESARRSIEEWIECFYNPLRRHTTLGGASPIRYEMAWQMRRQRS